jgi:hypothetical protein
MVGIHFSEVLTLFVVHFGGHASFFTTHSFLTLHFGLQWRPLRALASGATTSAPKTKSAIRTFFIRLSFCKKVKINISNCKVAGAYP